MTASTAPPVAHAGPPATEAMATEALAAGAGVRAGRFELLRALGAISATAGAASGPVSRALGLEEMSAADHTRVFVLDLPAYASIHLGPEGKLGGDGADRIAGMWRALGLTPPADADHLAVLLALYAELGEAAFACRTDAARRRLDHTRAVLLAEHLASWLPGYLTAASAYPPAAPWAALTAAALRRERDDLRPPDRLPAALRDAPPGPASAAGPDDLLDALVTPVRSGFVLTHRDLQQAGSATGLGVRRGERRYTLRAMFDQDPGAACGWLVAHARRWATAHRAGAAPGREVVAGWWASRAAATAGALSAGRPHPAAPAPVAPER